MFMNFPQSLHFMCHCRVLGENYLAMMSAVLEQLSGGRSPQSLVGHFDAPKLASSVQFFATWMKALAQSLLGSWRLLLDDLVEDG